MSFPVAEPFVVPEDVVVTPVRSLPAGLRRELEGDDDDFAVTRPRSRTPSRVVDASTAELLGRFREPTPIAAAIVAFSRSNGSDPEETLVEAFPALQRLVNDGLLVLASSADRVAIEAAFAPGDEIDGFTVRRVVQVLEDSEVYQGEAAGGRLVAIKVARAGAAGMARRLEREAAVLHLLDGTAAPRVAGQGEADARSYLAVEWLEGRDVVSEARAGDLTGAVDVARRLLDAYAALHARGVLHGDVHPRNTIVMGDGTVRLIDFGLADAAELPAKLRPRDRGGVAFFLEPELVQSRLDRRRPPRLDALGEQYGVAALVYLVVTGAHYVRFSPEKQAMRRQIVEAAPLSFAAVGAEPSPAVEAVVARALAKEPGERFASVADLAVAFRTAAHADRRRRRRRGHGSVASHGESLTRGLLQRLASRPDLPAPTASVTYGAAGVAYGLLRLARAREDAALLAEADLWSLRALALSAGQSAFASAELDIGPATVGRSSPYHTESGVHWVRACVSHAMADVVGFGEACDALVLASQDLTRNPDLTLGRAGTLVAYGSLVELARALPHADVAVVREAGDELAATLAAQLGSLGPLADEPAMRFLGIAHGWAGIVYALLRWSESTGQAPSGLLGVRLDELASAAEPSGDGLRWPRLGSTPSRASDYVPSWCNGSAGFVHLWLAAERATADQGYRELASGAARDALGPAETGADLCCGLAGRAYAALALHRASGDERWLKDAERLALRALRPGVMESPLALSLYKGAFGPAILAAEIGAPARASMPLFEPEGWAPA